MELGGIQKKRTTVFIRAKALGRQEELEGICGEMQEGGARWGEVHRRLKEVVDDWEVAARSAGREVKSRVRRRRSEDRAWRRLAEAARGRRCEVVEEVKWVADNLLFLVKQIEADTVPRSSSVALLRWARSNPTAFWQSYHAKMIGKFTGAFAVAGQREVGGGDSQAEDSIDSLLGGGRVGGGDGEGGGLGLR